jgi:ABC-type siderophore export system fused ATPase/permease subunit
VFYETLLPELARRGKTVLVVTHDDRYFGRADQIIHMESGQLVAPRIWTSTQATASAPDAPTSTDESMTPLVASVTDRVLRP